LCADMNTEQCRLRVAAFIIPRNRIKAFTYEGCPGKFQFRGWVLPDEWNLGQSEKIKARFVRVE
jgi:hypothetical protein